MNVAHVMRGAQGEVRPGADAASAFVDREQAPADDGAGKMVVLVCIRCGSTGCRTCQGGTFREMEIRRA